MSKFFVGQRVKRVRGVTNIGLTGTIVMFGDFGRGVLDGRLRDIQVRYDKAWINANGKMMPATNPAHGEQRNLEPIIPEGMQPAEWKNCLWQPEHLKSTA